MSEELKSCPFCGCTPEKLDRFNIKCPACGIELNALPELLDETWNRRQEAKPLKCAYCGPDGIVRYAGGEHICEHCGGSGNMESSVSSHEAKPTIAEQIEEVIREQSQVHELMLGSQRIEDMTAAIYDLVHAVLPHDQSARITELERSLQFVNATLESRSSEIARLYKHNDAIEAKIARAIELIGYAMRDGELLPEHGLIDEAIEILEAKP